MKREYKPCSTLDDCLKFSEVDCCHGLHSAYEGRKWIGYERTPIQDILSFRDSFDSRFKYATCERGIRHVLLNEKEEFLVNARKYNGYLPVKGGEL